MTSSTQNANRLGLPWQDNGQDADFSNLVKLPEMGISRHIPDPNSLQRFKIHSYQPRFHDANGHSFRNTLDTQKYGEIHGQTFSVHNLCMPGTLHEENMEGIK